MRPLAVVPAVVPASVAAAAAAAADSASPVAVVLAVAAALILAVLLAEAVAAVLRAAGRRRWLWAHLSQRARNPVRLLLAVVGVWVGVGVALGSTEQGTPAGFDRACAVGTVLGLTWLLGVAAPACVDAVLGRYRPDAPGHRHARGSQALAGTARGVVRAAVLLGGAAGVLLVLPATRLAGLVLLGVFLLILAALVGAALPWLRDVAAGLELAAADALRVDDVVSLGSVVGDGVWGRVEEITATTVVVQAWDDRRVVVPARALAEAPFENWTRRTADLVGSVEVDLEPTVPVSAVRAALLQAIEGNDLWDRRVAVLQVVDATGGRVRVRAVVSAADAPQLADLRCDVREALVNHLARVRPGQPGAPAAPTTGAGGRHSGETTMTVDPRKDSRLFTGSLFAVERSLSFTGPGAEVLAERDAAAEGSPES